MWDDRYGTDEYVFGTEPNEFLAEQAQGLAPGRVLCIAEGEGRNAVWLAEQGHAVTAVDGSAVGLAKARRLAASRGVRIETVHADLSEYAIEPGGFDLVVSIFGHLPPALRRDVHGRCAAGLRPGGRMILEAYTPRQLKHGTGGPPTTELMMTADALREDFAGLEFLVLEERERPVHEGRGHDGLAAVVQLVARKPAPVGGAPW
jgi:SAM-dependent methyltransferase